MSQFTQESVDQLKAAGVGLFKTASGLADGIGPSDITNALVEVQLGQQVVDEIQTNKPKAIAIMLGAALDAFGTS